jgi:oligopeptide/dipeptide ABC transporter ATP-binding protein
MQMVFQDPYGSFNPKMRLGASLSEVGAYFGLSRRETRERIAELLNCVNLSEDVLMRTPRELSGGQLQRLAIARALFMKPVFAVADEPVSALDVSVSAQLLNLLYDLRETAGLTMLFISHDILAVKYLCDRVAVMYLGSIVEVCDAADLFDKALHPYTRALLASAPALGAKLTSAIKGDTLDTQHGAQTEGCRFYARCTVRADVCLTQKPALKPISENHCAACHMCGENRAYNI